MSSKAVAGIEERRTSCPFRCSCRSSGIPFALLSGTLLLVLLLAPVHITNLFQLQQAASSITSSTSTGSEPPHIVASGQNPTSSCCGHALDPTMWGDVERGGGTIEDDDETSSTTATTPGDDRKTCCSSNTASEATLHYTRMVIPFFRGGDDDAQSSSWSRLNHRLEEYRQDLVKVVQVNTRSLTKTPTSWGRSILHVCDERLNNAGRSMLVKGFMC